MKKITLMSILIVVLINGLMLSGCSKKEEPAPPDPGQTMNEMHSHDHEQTEEMTAHADETIEQKVCPVMGAPIDKTLFVEYEGKKVYFCCAACIDKFKENPEKYTADLPQFKAD